MQNTKHFKNNFLNKKYFQNTLTNIQKKYLRCFHLVSYYVSETFDDVCSLLKSPQIPTSVTLLSICMKPDQHMACFIESHRNLEVVFTCSNTCMGTSSVVHHMKQIALLHFTVSNFTQLEKLKAKAWTVIRLQSLFGLFLFLQSFTPHMGNISLMNLSFEPAT